MSPFFRRKKMKGQKKYSLIYLALILLFAVSITSYPAQQEPLTVAEASQFTATSRYADVMNFINELQRKSPLIRLETLCTSAEGRAVPLVIIGQPVPFAPHALRHDQRAVIYIQANIHAGEVEGKEACLMLARDIVLKEKPAYLDKLVLLIAPIFNADGNEKISPDNRRSQAGPEKGVGVRHNGQNLDLNRDGVKLESPELQGLVRNVLIPWDPVLLVDCHTTNGSYHDHPVTYSWPLNPNGDTSIIEYMRDKMMPAINKNLEDKYNTLSIPYGNFVNPGQPEKGWSTLEHHPRFLSNYIGLRNRLAILDENYSYADYKTRVLGCYNFLRAILDYCHSRRDEIAQLIREADRKTIQRGLNPSEKDVFSLEFEMKPLKEPVTVRGYEMEVIPREGMWPQVKRTDKKKSYTIPYIADFVPKRSVRFPYAYLIPLTDPEITNKLRQHGICVEKLTSAVTLEVESFKLKEVKSDQRPYQGHHMNSVKGEYFIEQKEFPAGTLFVGTAQPLASLAAYLLEPESDDGLVVWNFFDRYLFPQWSREPQTYPAYRLLRPANLAKESVG